MLEKKRADLTQYIQLAIVFIIALAFRVYGLAWSLPNDAHKYSYHPDELLLVASALGMVSLFTLNPKFYNYGTFYIYLIGIAAVFAVNFAHSDQNALWFTYLGARVFSAAFGSLTILAVFQAAKQYSKSEAAIISAFLLSITPLHIIHSHFATVDATATFFSTVAIVFGIAAANNCDIKNGFLAGLFAGLAAGTKYNAGMVFISAITGVCLGSTKNSFIKRVTSCIFGAAVGFFIGTPGAFIWTQDFLKGLRYELAHSAAGHGFVFVNTGPGWLWHIRSSLFYGLGPPLLLFVVLGLIYSVVGAFQGKKESIVLLSGLIPYYFLASISEVRFARYLLPVIPLMVILAADGLSRTYHLLANNKKIAGNAWAALCFASALFTFLYAVDLTKLFTGDDPRDQAYRWMQKNIPYSSSIAFPTIPWFYSPPVTRETTALDPFERYQSLSNSQDGWILLAKSNTEFDESLLQGKPAYVVVSDFEYIDRLRAGDVAAQSFMAKLRTSYKQKAVFRRKLMFFDAESLPHDMKYIAPTIYIFSRAR